MFKKFGITILLIGVLAVTGCSVFTGTETPTPTPVVNAGVPEVTPVEVQPVDNVYDAGMPVNAPDNQTWLSPGKLEINNYIPGATVKCILHVHNGNSVATPFSILYSIPDNSDAGYVIANSQSRYWVEIDLPNPVIEPMSTKDITVTLSMPLGVTAPGNKWEFWVCSKDVSQDTFIQTQLCTKFQVTMAE